MQMDRVDAITKAAFRSTTAYETKGIMAQDLFWKCER